MVKRIYIVLFLLSLITQSCIKDDLSDCPQRRYIWFESINPKYKYGIIAKQVNLYLYDEQQRFVSELIYSTDELNQSNGKVYIPDQIKGTYMVVALVNLSDSYQVYDTERLEMWKLLLQDINDNKVFVRPPDIYHAVKNISFGSDINHKADTLYLEKNTNHIYLTITSNEPSVLEKIRPYIRASNSMSNYENLLLGERVIDYYPHDIEKYTNQAQYSLTTMLLRMGGDASMYLEEQKPDGSVTDRKLFNITQELIKIRNNNGEKLYDTNLKLALEDEFKFIIVLDEASKIIDLKINDWYVIKNYIVIK